MRRKGKSKAKIEAMRNQPVLFWETLRRIFETESVLTDIRILGNYGLLANNGKSLLSRQAQKAAMER